MAKKKASKVGDVDRRFEIAEDRDLHWGDLLKEYFEDHDVRMEVEGFSKEADDRQMSPWYSIDNLMSGKMDGIRFSERSEVEKRPSKAPLKEKGLAAFTLTYQGQGLFRYALPSEA